jgi:hypothetical protein
MAEPFTEQSGKAGLPKSPLAPTEKLLKKAFPTDGKPFFLHESKPLLLIIIQILRYLDYYIFLNIHN